MKAYSQALRKRWQILTHANGDRAIDQLIEDFGKARAAVPGVDVRPVLIHGQTLREDQVGRLQSLGILPSLFPMHTFYWGDWHRSSVLGPERAENILHDRPRKSAVDRLPVRYRRSGSNAALRGAYLVPGAGVIGGAVVPGGVLGKVGAGTGPGVVVPGGMVVGGAVRGMVVSGGSVPGTLVSLGMTPGTVPGTLPGGTVSGTVPGNAPGVCVPGLTVVPDGGATGIVSVPVPTRSCGVVPAAVPGVVPPGGLTMAPAAGAVGLVGIVPVAPVSVPVPVEVCAIAAELRAARTAAASVVWSFMRRAFAFDEGGMSCLGGKAHSLSRSGRPFPA